MCPSEQSDSGVLAKPLIFLLLNCIWNPEIILEKV